MKNRIYNNLKTMKKTIIFLGLMISFFAASAQERGKHEIRAGISDASGIVIGDEFGNAFADVFSYIFTAGNFKKKYTKDKVLGMFEIGYRYELSDRVKIGGDISYLQMDKSFEQTVFETTTKHTIRGQYLMVLPTAEFAYIKTPMLTFYGTAAMGVLIGREKDMSSDKSFRNNLTQFAFQVNPVGLRVGKKIGAFVELGYGLKGIATAGVSLRF